MPLDDILSKRDAILILELIHKTLSCRDEEQFSKIVMSMKELVPFDLALTGLANLDPLRKVKSYNILNVNYPAEWLEVYIIKGYQAIDPVVRENFARFSLQRWKETFTRHKAPRDFLHTAGDFGLTKGYTHGVKSLRGEEGSIFSFSGATIEYTPRTEAILEHIVPHLHNAMSLLLRPHDRRKEISLSPREKEVLKWLSCGKSTWDISIILSISERTVNFHVSNIMQKLNAVSRTHAVAVALELGLIAIE